MFSTSLQQRLYHMKKGYKIISTIFSTNEKACQLLIMIHFCAFSRYRRDILYPKYHILLLFTICWFNYFEQNQKSL